MAQFNVWSALVGLNSCFTTEFGGCSRIRTYDPLIKSQLLYQLSYAPIRSNPHGSAWAGGYSKAFHAMEGPLFR